MKLTRDYKQTIAERIKRDPAFAQALLDEAETGALPAYAPDDGPLSAKQVRALCKDASERLPKGSVLSTEVLFNSRQNVKP